MAKATLDMKSLSSWKDEQHCERLVLEALTPKAQRDLASYVPKIHKSLEKWFVNDIQAVR